MNYVDPKEILRKVRAENAAAKNHGDKNLSLNDFYAYMPTHSYLFVPTRQTWAGSSVSSRIPPQVLIGHDGKPVLDDNGKPKTISAGTWLDRNRPVEQMTWAPGKPMIIEEQLISEGGWIEHNGVKCFNLYRPPTIIPGNADMAERWLEHVEIRPSTCLTGLPIACSAPERRSITPSCSAAHKVSARTPRSNQSNAQSGRGISVRCRHTICSGGSTGF